VRNRKERRNYLFKAKQKAKFVINKIWGVPEGSFTIKNYNHLKSCSCCECGNPRKHFKKITKQEKIDEIRSNEEIKEFEVSDEAGYLPVEKRGMF